MIELERQQDVFVLRMRGGENRFNEESLAALNRRLDEVEASQGAAALVTTGEGKFYSNGLDLDAMARDSTSGRRIVDGTQRLLCRMLTLPLPSVAACNGHAFAAGAMFALAHDFRVMRADRGWFCLPEIDIKLPFTPLMDALIRAKLAPATAHEAMVFGRRYTGPEAVDAQIAHACADEAEVVARAVERAAPLAGKDRNTMTAIKRRMYDGVLSQLEEA